ncbi:MAG: D-alanine--D-alanine ligase family protein [Thermoproteota archaeon]
MTKSLTIGFVYNVRSKKYDEEFLKKYTEWDYPETIEAISGALEETGNKVIHIEADRHVFHKLEENKDKIDIAFNIAEYISKDLFGAENREALVPMLLEFLNIPYSGSGPQALINALDKAATKEIVSAYGVGTAAFQVVREYPFELDKRLKFPLVVKASCEGSSIALKQTSKVNNEEELNERVKEVITVYNQPALIEEYIEGTEYTIGFVGRLIVPIMKIDLSKIPGHPSLRDQEVKDMEPEYTFLKVKEKDKQALSLLDFDETYVYLATQAAISHDALRVRDFNRMDVRLKDGKFYFLEMNPLPGMHPNYGDLPTMAKGAGIAFDELVNMILMEAIRRYANHPLFKERFSQKRIEKIEEKYNKTLQKLEFYDREVKGIWYKYRLVKKKDL